MTTKVPAELSSTPSIVDNGNATAITIDSSEDVTVNNGTLTSSGANGVGNQGFHITDTGYSKTHKLFGDNSLHIQADSGQSILMKPNASEIARFTSDGLTFNGDTAAANALDDYEEGTFTPTIVSGATSVSYSTQAGHYTKIGNTMTVHMRVQPSSLTKQGSLLVFDGLPESCKLSTYGAGIVSYTSSFANENVNLYINPGSTQISIYKRIGTSFVGNDLVSTAFDFRIMAVYLT